MIRITNRALYNNTLTNLFKQSEGLLKVHEELASGKRVNRPSDDPLAMGEIMKFQSRLTLNSKYQDLLGKTEAMLNISESYVASATELAVRARELALSQIGGNAGVGTRQITASEISQLKASAIAIGNAKIGNEYIFSGRSTNIEAIDQNGFYRGDHQQLDAEISENSTIKMSVLASDFLTANLAPRLSASTAVSTLSGGQGISAGSFTITDRAGATGTVTVNAGDTIGGVLASINGSGANVTAAISADGMSIEITDNNTTVTGPMVIAESGGSTASDLGLVGSRPVRVVTGNELSPSISSTTLLSDLYGGKGITMSDISIANGATSGTVSFGGATTIGEVIALINTAGAGMNIIAGINSAGTGLTVTSTDASTVAYAVDNAGTTAEMLGIGGGRNFIKNLERLEQALLLNDTAGIRGLLQNINNSVDTITSLRGTIGARGTRVIATYDLLEKSNYDTVTLLSNAQDADFAKSASELALLQTAYQATVKSSAAILQQTLMDFIR